MVPNREHPDPKPSDPKPPNDDPANTVADEQNATNYRVLSDYIAALRESWIGLRDRFMRSSNVIWQGLWSLFKKPRQP